VALKRVFNGLTVVVIGFILLANTTGALPWTVWWNILLLWPLLIVALGIDILGRSLGSTVLRVLGSLVVIAGLLYGALSGSGRVPLPVFAIGQQRQQTFAFAEPPGTASTGRVSVQGGLSRLTLRDGTDLASVRGTSPFGAPGFHVTTSGAAADVSITSADGRGGIVFPSSARSFLDVTLGRPVRWDDVRVDAGASDIDLDLSSLLVQRLEANVGLSNTTITFGSETKDAQATVEGGLSSFRLRVPRSLGVELAVQNGLGSVDPRGGWQRTSGNGPFDGTWRSDGYDSSASKLRLVVQTGLSSVVVERF
jgi:hypothetical protein